MQYFFISPAWAAPFTAAATATATEEEEEEDMDMDTATGGRTGQT